MRIDTTRLALASVAVVAIVVTACGGSGSADPSDGVATLSDADTETTRKTDGNKGEADESGVEAPTDEDDAFRLYEQCLADHDIDFDFTGENGEDGEDGTENGFEVDPDAWIEADEECQGHLANVDDAFDMTPEQEVAFEEAERAANACLEEAGFEPLDMGIGSGLAVAGDDEDPDGGAGLDENVDWDAFEDAMQECWNEVATSGALDILSDDSGDQ